jgi:sensor histidine kinase YesM
MFKTAIASPAVVTKKNLTDLGAHVFVWILYFFYENGMLMIIAPSEVSLTSTLILFLLNAFIFYVNTYIILPRTLGKNKRWQLILQTLLLGVAYVALNYGITRSLAFYKVHAIYSTDPLNVFVLLRIFRFIYFISLSYAYYLAVNTIRTERRLRKLDEIRIEETRKKAHLEKEILNTELNYLRYQIHPHFLFNTLSFIYTQVREHSPEAGKSVMLLSDIMRYALDNHDEEGKVKIENEIRHILNLIEIHQLRFNNELFVDVNICDNIEYKYRRITPLLLITFVENAFKYGDLQDPEHPLKIHISMNDGHFRFFIQNKKKQTQSLIDSRGIGLSNIKKRLSLTYNSDQYQLDIEDVSNLYTVTLNLNL